MKKMIVILSVIVGIGSIITALCAQEPVQTEQKMQISTNAFGNNEMIPPQYTRFHSNINPPLTFKNIPAGTQSLALIVEDPDAPSKTWVHWIMFNIPVQEKIKANSIPGTPGRNDFGHNKYDGPQPPSGTHRYIFTLYALNKSLDAREGITKEELMAEMKGYILEKAHLVGLYARQQSDK